MTCPLLDLPAELESMIVDELEDMGDEDMYFPRILLPLSFTCKRFHELLAARIFHCLRFTNEPESADLELEMAKIHGTYFRRLHFCGASKKASDVSRGKRKKIAQRPWGERADELLCPAARELLLGTHTPNATCANITFSFDFEDKKSEFALTEAVLEYVDERPGHSREVAFYFGQEEDEEDIGREERTKPWRALMKLVWQTLSQNSTIRNLEMKRTIPKLSQAFSEEYNPCWRQFLGRLRSMDMSFAKDDDTLHDATGFLGFMQFTEALNEGFLSPAQNLRMLSIVGPEYSLLGYDAQIALGELQFSNLTTLTLGHICVNRGLIAFLKAHTKTLTTLLLSDCWSCGTLAGEEPTQWAELFRALQGPDSALSTFNCLPDGKSCYTSINGFVVDEVELHFLRECDKAVKNGKGKRPFLYATPGDEDFYALLPNPKMVLASLRAGEDQKEYDALMSESKQRLETSRPSPFRDANESEGDPSRQVDPA